MIKKFLCAIILVFFSSCATAPSIQPQVNGLVVAERFDRALNVLEKNKEGYGKNNELLFLLDKGLVLHLAGRYEESITVLEQAKLKFEQLYTRSISKGAATWVYNDYAAPYYGEDFERVMVNIFQALNFAALGNLQESLVDARDVDSILTAINAQYAPNQKNVYREDAFARFLMGIFYESLGDLTNINDAYISYRKAIDTYENDYRKNYKTAPPRLLIENLLAAAELIDPNAYKEYREKYRIKFFPIKKKQELSEVYLVHYNGLSPLKYQSSIVFPLPGGQVSKIAFPRYKKRVYTEEKNYLTAVADNKKKFRRDVELGEDITAIAIKNLDNRKVRVMAKAVLRPAGKYFVEKAAEDSLRQSSGDGAANAVRVAGGVYNIYSEQSDLRAWQTLPAEFRISRLVLPPGDYELRLDEMPLGRVSLKAGEKKFILKRTSR